MTMQCQHPNCSKDSRGYFMGWTDANGVKRWGFVCAGHDRLLGRSNLVQHAGMTHDEARVFETYLKETENAEHPIAWDKWLDIRRLR